MAPASAVLVAVLAVAAMVVTVADATIYVSSQNYSFAEAIAYCGTNSGRITNVDDAGNNAVLTAKATNKATEYWIGLNDLLVEGNLVWSDDATMQQRGYQNWYTNYTNNESLNCVSLRPVDGKWTLRSCQDRIGVLCQSQTGIQPQYDFSNSAPLNFTWYGARDWCASRGAYLAKADAAGLWNKTLVASNGASVWIGLNDIKKEGSFAWMDLAGVSASRWTSGKPNAAATKDTDDCVMIDQTTRLWNDVNCSLLRPAVCMKMPKPPTRSPTAFDPLNTRQPTSKNPTTSPTQRPTAEPSSSPSTTRPSKAPSTSRPTLSPSTKSPTSKPSQQPSQSPTTKAPTTPVPTKSPTKYKDYYSAFGTEPQLNSNYTWNYYQAIAFCARYSGRLAVINNEDENLQAQLLLRKYSRSFGWIGYSDFLQNDFVSSNGSTLTGYTNWNANQPAGTPGNRCVKMSRETGTWFTEEAEKCVSVTTPDQYIPLCERDRGVFGNLNEFFYVYGNFTYREAILECISRRGYPSQTLYSYSQTNILNRAGYPPTNTTFWIGLESVYLGTSAKPPVIYTELRWPDGNVFENLGSWYAETFVSYPPGQYCFKVILPQYRVYRTSCVDRGPILCEREGYVPAPTKSPTVSPSVSPSEPTRSPSRSPSTGPTGSPTWPPTTDPTGSPTRPPSPGPTTSPSGSTQSPTTPPSTGPTSGPTESP